MKARIKATGEIIDVVQKSNQFGVCINDVLYNGTGVNDYRTFKPHELEFITASERDMNFTPNPYKPMSEREKEIMDAAIYDSYTNADKRGINPFTAGAKWADEHPAKKDIDWEQRRYELAKSAMQGLLNATSVERFTLRIKPQTIAETAIEYADAIIKELKTGES